MVFGILLLFQAVHVEIPKAPWTRWFYGDRQPSTTDLLARSAGLVDLRKRRLPPGVSEVRHWSGYSWMIRGTAFRQVGGRWTVRHVSDTRTKDSRPLRTAPRHGWSNFWLNAEKLGIYTLPDESTLGGIRRIVHDGSHEIVEYQRNGKYRAYHYYSPEIALKTPQTTRMMKLSWLIEDEFNP